MTLKKIVSGGQTGVDRAALDAALALSFPCGGWAPGDGMAEDGVVSDSYGLMRLPKGGYRQRTRMNVVDSGGTVIIYFEALKGGTRLTRNLCALEMRSYLLIDAQQIVDPVAAADMVSRFVEENHIETLNVSGPRASGWAAGYAYTLAVIAEVLSASLDSLDP